MDQVVRGVHAAKGVGERARVQHVTRDDFGAVGHPGAEILRPAGHAAERPPTGLERAAQPAPDVAARAGEKGEPALAAHSTSSAASRRSIARSSGNDSITSAPAASASAAIAAARGASHEQRHSLGQAGAHLPQRGEEIARPRARTRR